MEVTIPWGMPRGVPLALTTAIAQPGKVGRGERLFNCVCKACNR
jgi:hypothetical protein